MKILTLGDTHFRLSNPSRRIDDFFDTQLRKFSWCLDLAEKEKCDVVVVPGDFFDSPYVADYCKQRLISLIKGCGHVFDILTVYGQHDLYFRSEKAKDKVSLKVMESAECVIILDEVQLEIGLKYKFYGVSYGQEIPLPSSDGVSILVIHAMVSDKKLPFDYMDAETLLKANKNYDLIISGDNHKCFVVNSGDGRLLINQGAMCRKNFDEMDSEPSVFVIDIDSKGVVTFDTHYIPIEKPEKVFDMMLRSDFTPDVADPELEKLVVDLKEAEFDTVDFKAILEKYLMKMEGKMREGVRNILEEVITKLGGK